MYGNEWMNRAKMLRQTAQDEMNYYQPSVWVEGYFSEEYVEEMIQLDLYDYAEVIINDVNSTEKMKFLAVAIKFDLVDYEDAGHDTILMINIDSFEILNEIVDSYLYEHCELDMYNWEKDNQIEFIVDTVKTYFCKDKDLVKEVWENIPWCNIAPNVLDIIEPGMLDAMEDFFGSSGFDEDSLRLYIKLTI